MSESPDAIASPPGPPLLVGVVAEPAQAETRVALSPETVGKVLGLGYAVTVESGAGVRAGFEDAAYASGLPTIEVDVEVVEDLGSDAHVFFHVDAAPITAEILEAAADSTLLQVDRALFAARVDPRSAARPAGRLELAVDPGRFHFFDPDSGERLSPLSAAELQPAG